MVIWSFIWIGFESVASRLLVPRTTVGRSVSGPAAPERKIAGALGATVKLKLSLTPPGVWTIIVTFPIAWNGICALICVGETNKIGNGWPFTVRQLSASAVGTGISLVARFVGASWLPKIEISPPGAT